MYKVRAIEAHQATGRTNPEITITGLLDCLDRLFRQPVLNVSGSPRVLRLNRSLCANRVLCDKHEDRGNPQADGFSVQRPGA